MKKALLLAPMSSVHERFNIVNIDALKELKYKIHIAANFEYGDEFALEHNLYYKNRLTAEGITVHQIPFQRKSLLRNINAINMCKELFSTENFDLIHAHTETGGFITRLAMPKGISNTKYIYTPHGMSFYKGSPLKNWIIYYPIEKWICKKMNANIAMNREELYAFEKWNCRTAKFIHGVGLDINSIKNTHINPKEKREELGIPQDALVILSIGELNENKNHETIIKALSKMGSRNVYYLICGEGPLKKYLQKLSKSLGIESKVIFAGYRRDISQVVKAVDLFAFPSFHEGLPVSLMEAMAAGLPVVCSQIRGTIDLIKDKEGGFLCKPLDVNGFCRAIDELSNNTDLANKMGKINLFEINKFSRETVYKETINIYSNAF